MTENRTLYDILSRFHSFTITRPPSSQTATVAPRCFPGLTFPDFDLATKREVWLLRTGFGIAPVNKLVSLTWLLWALRSFRSFTLHLHYITLQEKLRSKFQSTRSSYVTLLADYRQDNRYATAYD